MISLLALFAVAAAAAAQNADDAPLYARTASDVTQAIHAGKSLREVAPVPALTDAELAEISRLAGCKPSLRPGTTKNFVAFDWSCGSVSASEKRTPIAPRTIEMRFTDEGRMFSLTVNPSVGSFAPTPAALATPDLPKRRVLAKAFGQAVSDGADATLAGIVPLTELQQAQLKPLASRKVEIYEGASGSESILVVWQIKSSPGDGDYSGKIYFDKVGRPIGVTLEPSLIRRTTFISAKPL